MSDKFEAWYKKTFTVNMKFDLQDCWETAYDSGYNQGLVKGRTESKLMDRHTIETYVEKAVLDERERIVGLIRSWSKQSGDNAVFTESRRVMYAAIADLLERETE